MNKNLLTIATLILTVVQVNAQGPTLNLVGGSVLSKGTINTEVLTAIIQQKQEELRIKVFRDIVVANFQKADQSQKNFATYYYIYNVMKTITSEKNKTIITQNLMQRTTEVALVYGLTEYLLATGLKEPDKTNFYQYLEKIFPSEKDTKSNLKSYGFENKPVIQNFSLSEIKTIVKKENKFEEPKEIYKKYGSLLLDMAFDALINNDTIKARKIFKDDFSKNELQVWYKADNEYQKLLKGKDSANVKACKKIIDDQLTAFIKTVDATKEVGKLFNNLKAKSQGLTDLTEEQYIAMRNLIKEFIDIIRFNYNSTVVANISDFILDYTLIEYSQDASKKSTLYVDIESLISALDKQYNSKSRKSSVASGWFLLNPRPFFSIGTNYASFVNTNTLSKDDKGNSQNLRNLYFASEKIGFKIKFFDLKYSRSFEPGEKFKYMGTERVWLRPQKQSIISDMHLIVYGSGLLYNIANLKSNDNFNYAIIGSSIGMTFFNGLSANIGIACPYTDKRFNQDNMYINFGFDIPIIDYISALTKKN
jgi:hypothetical protein